MKNMRNMRKMKQLLAWAFLLMFILTGVMQPIKAHASSYSVNVNSDGTADIVEKWTICFESGSFTRFYKDIVINAGTEDAVNLYTDSVYVRIDGTDCTQTEDTEGRPDYTFHLEKSSMGAQVDCYKSSQNVTRTYEIGYRIGNAVKRVDDSYDLFTFRLIGANFPQTVKKVNVTVTTPEGAVNDLRYASHYDEVSGGGNVTNISASSCSGM